MIVATTLAIGAVVVGRGLEEGVTAETLVTLNRPLLGIVTLILMASAALGSWEGYRGRSCWSGSARSD